MFDVNHRCMLLHFLKGVQSAVLYKHNNNLKERPGIVDGSIENFNIHLFITPVKETTCRDIQNCQTKFYNKELYFGITFASLDLLYFIYYLTE